ncbi:hypothetical protein EGN72_02940 [Pseudorhodobacter sp. E13]|uniref:hypothetical protein n=1 Tax=Pseudorhodobacter sp. E13 TaxID=2487931 RepID=UPI000F8E8CAD|nr:hypothetical protein [Pseudorhodobacter sp. E13]RUS63693.1 hypothetical protein EGN72_02940 [Pseudorhodobacter sp. E13]
MKHALALCALLLPLPALAGPADLNLYLSYWPEGAEEAAGALNLELENGVLAQLVFDKDGNETVIEAEASATNVALMQGAIRAMLDQISLDQQPSVNGPALVVEWSVATDATFARGNIVLPFDAQPEAILAVQDQIFSARLTGN